MKFKTIIVGILLGLLALTLFSCSPSQRLGTLKKKHPEIFTTKIDTITKIITVRDTATVTIFRDTAVFDTALVKYVTVVNKIETLINSSVAEERWHDIIKLTKEKDSLRAVLRRGDFEPTHSFWSNDTISFEYIFDPSNHYKPMRIFNIKYPQRDITKETTGTTTNSLSLKQWLFLAGSGIVVLAIIAFKIFTR